MCDVCSDFLQLLVSSESRANNEEIESTTLKKNEVEIALLYIQTWPQRQCMCCYRDIKNFDRFNVIVQNIICLTICQLKSIEIPLEKLAEADAKSENETKSVETKTNDEETWILPEIEKLLLFLSKVFLLNFPLYIAYKHGVHSRLDELTAQEISVLNNYCDLHDNEIPLFLLRNVSMFCKNGGIGVITDCFELPNLPVSTAHAITAAVCNLKLWLNYHSIVQLFVPLRNKVLKYMCRLSDQDLRSPATRTMAEFMWAAVKDPLDARLAFDREGLELAFKYFTSSTLTMRLGGVAQINAHINMFNEICATETVAEAESVGRRLSDWLNENNIIGCIFGPNLHAEVVKQSHIILNFLAVEGRISEQHIDLIWQAAQSKHCSKPVHDLLPALVKNLAAAPALHLYSLLCRLDASEHTEQSLYIASALIKFIWSRGGSSLQQEHLTGVTGIGQPEAQCPSSSENSVSVEASNSEEEPGVDVSLVATGVSSAVDEDDDDEEEEEDDDEDEDEEEEHEHINLKKELDTSDDSLKLDLEDCIKQVSLKGCETSLIDDIDHPEMDLMGTSSEETEPILKASVRKRMLRRRFNTKSALSSNKAIDSEEEDLEQEAESASDVEEVASTPLIVQTSARLSISPEHDDETTALDRLAGLDSPAEALTRLSQAHTVFLSNLSHSHLLDILSGGEDDEEEGGSYSSAMSNKSEKNMADFDGEDSPCEDEIAQLAARCAFQASCVPSFTSIPRGRSCAPREPPSIPPFKICDVCKPGNTLLWDLLQDDKIGQLPMGLAVEAEKALYTLLCFSTEKCIRMKFIEGCLRNLENNWSVVISLRLLPKLLASFQQFRAMDSHQVTMWAERQHRMMHHFFSNLEHYRKSREEGEEAKVLTSPYTHPVQVQVRLQFLTAVFSSTGSPDNFRLTITQVDSLWDWLANDIQCSDCLFSWLQSQCQGGEQHALGVAALRHLYLTKLPTLQPEGVSMVALGLFQQLCSLARFAAAHLEPELSASTSNSAGGINSCCDGEVACTSHLWKIALRARSTDVSAAAMQYLNGYYMARRLRLEREFVSQCMSHLSQAERELLQQKPSSEQAIETTLGGENALLCIQRALLLLNTHLETFRRRYAYHLRRWALDGEGVSSHVPWSDRGCSGQPMKIVLQPGGLKDKASLRMLGSDYVADLRAEIASWWEGLRGTSGPGHAQALRIITQGQEICTEHDERTLQDVGFKDNQMVYVSIGVGPRSMSGTSRDTSECPSLQPAPPRDSLPTLLLLQPSYLEQLFRLMRTLGDMRAPGKNGNSIPHTKAQLLSRRVWDILTLLPTSPELLRGFEEIGAGGPEQTEQDTAAKLQVLLDPSNPQRLMYTLYIVEGMCRAEDDGDLRLCRKEQRRGKRGRGSFSLDVDEEGDKVRTESPEITEVSTNKPDTWGSQFCKHGGLKHLFSIFASGALQRGESGDDGEWRQDCLMTLLKLLCALGLEGGSDGGISTDAETMLTVPRLKPEMLSMMFVDTIMPRLTSILSEAAVPRDPLLYKTGFWGRGQVVHYAMTLLVSWVHCSAEARAALWDQPEPGPCTWLQRLVLDDPEPRVRREACAALYRICLQNGRLCPDMSGQMLEQLVAFLPRAEGMRPNKELIFSATGEEGKEPYGPACRDYFWLLCRLVDSLSMEKPDADSPGTDCIQAADLQQLAQVLSTLIQSRPILEPRTGNSQDDGLIGLLNLAAAVMRHEPPFKTGPPGAALVTAAFDCLFALPTPKERLLPKCKSQTSRAAAYDLLVELVKGASFNYALLHGRLLAQHRPGPGAPFPWDYWPREEGRAEAGYVGLTNLGATCYMASCVQHLYMMPQARAAVLAATERPLKHAPALAELRRMFAYLLESERKAYNPRSFCRVYQMDHQPLNTGEQKDMAEFFIDLVSKMEEMTPELKRLVKRLFCGVLSNNVVSLDCDHVSRTLEEFYTVRCQVADMRNLHESLAEVTVKDTLDGDNMYTCSQCGRKVRAEKRACFKKLPHILCFNTMRYTFNMLTMLKEKVNTHFSFPLRLDMSGYVEKELMPQHYQEEKQKSELNKSEPKKSDSSDKLAEDGPGDTEDFNEHYEYDLVGVTVHTGTADGGHYYSFIRERGGANPPAGAASRWLLFNDAEVKTFDPSQIAAECFGGEMTVRSKTYDSVTDKYLDFSFEKTNSAYMLFYEWRPRDGGLGQRGETQDANMEAQTSTSSSEAPTTSSPTEEQPAALVPGQLVRESITLDLSPELEEWIWQDNQNFLQDRNIFEHTYFNFMWQICGHVPQTLIAQQPDITCLAAQLSTSFFLETFIHAKEKPTMVQWVELLTKQFNGSEAACEWFLEQMCSEPWWPLQVLIQCPNQMVRQMFQRLCIHVIQRLRQSHFQLYLKGEEDENALPEESLGGKSCVTRFIRSLISLLEHGARAHLRHLSEYFGLLLEFSRMGDEESAFLLRVGVIHCVVEFYLGQKSAQDNNEQSPGSDSEEQSGAAPGPGAAGVGVAAGVASPDKPRPASLDKMVALVASLVEKSRGPDLNLQLSNRDFSAIAGGKGFPFLYQQIRDGLNPQHTRHLVHALCRFNERLAAQIVAMMFHAITKHAELCGPFFKLLTLLTDPSAGPSGLPCFSNLALQRVWDAAEFCPHSALDWLAVQVPRNKMAHAWVLQSADCWVEHFLIAHNNQRVRAAAAYLLVSLIPHTPFRQAYHGPRLASAAAAAAAQGQSQQSTTATRDLPTEAVTVLRQVLGLLLRLLRPARHYADVPTHGTMKLTAYFALMTYFAATRTEKLMVGPHLRALWDLFHPRLSEPSVAAHHNKQALLMFWHHVTVDCPENAQLVVQNPDITRNIAFNYILADHDDHDVVVFNRAMLPAYYGLLRLCCQQSRKLTRQLAAHQNLQWAFKNITPHPTQYTAAVDELFRLMSLFAERHPDATETELREAVSFRRATLTAYLSGLDARSCWSTLIAAMKTLADTDEDRLYVLQNGGLSLVLEALHTLHVMYHEATACHVSGDLVELLSETLGLLRCLRTFREQRECRAALSSNNKGFIDLSRRLAMLLNSYNPPEMRQAALDILQELHLLQPEETRTVLLPLLAHCHAAFHSSTTMSSANSGISGASSERGSSTNVGTIPLGPYFPRRGVRLPTHTHGKGAPRPPRPALQMYLPHSQIQSPRGIDPEYDSALMSFYLPYHEFIDTLLRGSPGKNLPGNIHLEHIIALSAMSGYEAAPLHLSLFPALWLDALQAQQTDSEGLLAVLGRNVDTLVESAYLGEYLDCVLLDERISLTDSNVWRFMQIFFPKIASRVLTVQTCRLIENLCVTLSENVARVDLQAGCARLRGDVRALRLVLDHKASDASNGLQPPAELKAALERLKERVQNEIAVHAVEEDDEETPTKKRKLNEEETMETCSQSETVEAVKSISDEPAEPIEPQSEPAESADTEMEEISLEEINLSINTEASEEENKVSEPSTSTSTGDKTPPKISLHIAQLKLLLDDLEEVLKLKLEY